MSATSRLTLTDGQNRPPDSTSNENKAGRDAGVVLRGAGSAVGGSCPRPPTSPTAEEETVAKGDIKGIGEDKNTVVTPDNSLNNLVHLKTEETSRCNLSVMLDQSHVLSRNKTLLTMVDSAMLTSSSYSVPTIISPQTGCITGQALVEVKKAGVNGSVMGPLRVKSVKAVVFGMETIRMKMELPGNSE